MKPRIALIAVPPLNTRFPALNIALLSGELKAQGYETKCFDLNIEAFKHAGREGEDLWDFRNGHLWLDEDHFQREIFPKVLEPLMRDWMKRILAFNPDLVGISVTPNSFCRTLAKKLKTKKPKVRIIFGGPMCSKVMADTRYRPDEMIDVVVSDEGEHTLLDIVKNYEQSGSIPALPGTNVLVKGYVKYGGARPAIAKLDETAYPDFTDLDLSLYRDPGAPRASLELPIYTSRGCVGRCNFCMDYKMWSVYYRQKSPRRVADEMEHLFKTYGAKDFIFIELVFNGHHGWIKEFSEELKKRSLQFRFWSHGRVDGRLTYELLTALKEVGFWHFVFGMESASDKVLKLMRKGTTKAKTVANLLDCHRAEIMVSVNVIVGFPGEGTIEFLETAIFIVKYRKYISQVPSITPCYATPGTDLYLDPRKFQISLDCTSPRAPQEWVSLDGKNTFKVRWRRKQILEFVCRNILFRNQTAPILSSRYWRDRIFSGIFAALEPLHAWLDARQNQPAKLPAESAAELPLANT